MDPYVADLYERLRIAKRTVHKIEMELATLQAKCKHEYIRTRDDDYHRTRFVYTCRKCDHFTTEYQDIYITPQNKIA